VFYRGHLLNDAVDFTATYVARNETNESVFMNVVLCTVLIFSLHRINNDTKLNALLTFPGFYIHLDFYDLQFYVLHFHVLHFQRSR